MTLVIPSSISTFIALVELYRHRRFLSFFFSLFLLEIFLHRDGTYFSCLNRLPWPFYLLLSFSGKFDTEQIASPLLLLIYVAQDPLLLRSVLTSTGWSRIRAII